MYDSALTKRDEDESEQQRDDDDGPKQSSNRLAAKKTQSSRRRSIEQATCARRFEQRCQVLNLGRRGSGRSDHDDGGGECGAPAEASIATASTAIVDALPRLLESNRRDVHCAGIDRATRDRYCQPTLRRAWPRECSRPQCAFKMSMFNVSCNSHYFTQLAALFIDTRAE